MRQRFFVFLVVQLGLLNGEIFAQGIPGKTKRYSKGSVSILGFHQMPQIAAGQPKYFFDLNDEKFLRKVQKIGLMPVISPNYHSSQLSFFCNAEWQFEKVTRVPFRFRLGSVEYVDYLERKPNARR
jgi:hypothetical protein